MPHNAASGLKISARSADKPVVPWKRPPLLLAGFLFLAYSTVCPAQQFTFKTYGQSEGLDNLVVNNILQDRAGLLWLATEAGVIRYDGARFLLFDLPSDLHGAICSSLTQDIYGHIWVQTTDGTAYFEGTRFKSVLFRGNPIRSADNGQISAAPDGRVYVGSLLGVIAISPGENGTAWTSSLFGRPRLNRKTSVRIRLFWHCAMAI